VIKKLNNKDNYIIQESEFSFLNINIENNGKMLVGEFHTNEGSFELNET
jgi:hypothetical protein